LAGLELAPRGGPPVLPDLCGGRLIPTVPLAVPSSPSPDRTNGLVRSRATCYTGSKQSDVWGFQGGTSMLHLRPNDSVVDGNWPNDSDDDNALAEFCYAVLIEVGVGLGALSSLSSSGWPPRCSCTGWRPSCSDLGHDQLHALAVLRYWFGDLEVLAVLERDSSWPRDDVRIGSSTRQLAGPAPSARPKRRSRRATRGRRTAAATVGAARRRPERS
jgi:hypothetical protein